MQTIHPVKTENASVATKRLLDAAGDERGVISNMIKTMAQSPRALQGYLAFRHALSAGGISPAACEQIALVVAQTNLCEYSLAEHAHLASQQGLKREEILESREARATDKRTDAALRFARNLAAGKGESSVAELRECGWSDEEIIELIAHVSLNVFENCLNDVAHTDLDFPRVERSTKAA